MLKKVTATVFNNWLRFVSCAVFIISLTQKSFCTEGSCGDGIACLISGAIGFATGGAALTWLANPLLFLSWILIHKNPKLSLQISIAATLIALSFLFFKQIMADEAGNYSRIISYKFGYWLWVSSSVIMFVGNLVSKYFIMTKVVTL